MIFALYNIPTFPLDILSGQNHFLAAYPVQSPHNLRGEPATEKPDIIRTTQLL